MSKTSKILATLGGALSGGVIVGGIDAALGAASGAAGAAILTAGGNEGYLVAETLNRY